MAMKHYHQQIDFKIETVNDCEETKCINCFNNNGCIYKRSAYEMTVEITAGINTEIHQKQNKQNHFNNRYRYGL
jgi:hypothetical protein